VIVDAHQHTWNLDRARYDWLNSGLAPIDRTMDLAEILPTMHEAGVGATILVQSADNPEDTANMIGVADAHPEVVGIVAWVPLDEPQRADDMLERLGKDRRIVGVRNLLHTRQDPAWVRRSEVDAGLGVLESRGVALDYVTGDPAALNHVPDISGRHPGLAIVIDHLGKPPVGGSLTERKRWRALLAAAAENPRVVAKISGLYPSTGELGHWTIDLLRPFVNDALDIFGPSRLMFGGDWPISELAGGYSLVWESVSELLGTLPSTDRDEILGGTAAAFYKLDAALLAAARPPGKEDS
jgi:L-fuconolactonase